MSRNALIISLMGWLSCTEVLGQGKMPGMVIARVTDSIYVCTTYSGPGNGKPFPANCVYAIADCGVVLIDTPWDTLQVRPLLDSIRRRHGKEVISCIATHFHADRTGGFDILKRYGVKTYSTHKTRQLCKERGEKQSQCQIDNDTKFNTGNLHYETFYPGGGHTADNIVVWFPQKKVLVGGCLVKSMKAKDMGNTADAVIREWPMAIENLHLKYPDARYVIPGHQSWRGDPLGHTLNLLKKNWKSLTKKQ